MVAADLAVQRADQQPVEFRSRSGGSARHLTVPPGTDARLSGNGRAGTELPGRTRPRRGIRPHDVASNPAGSDPSARAHLVAEPALDPVCGRPLDRPPCSRRSPIRAGSVAVVRANAVGRTTSRSPPARATRYGARAPEVIGSPEPMRQRGARVAPEADVRGSSATPGSGSEPVAALAAAGGQDRATGAGAHAQAEAVRLVAPAVVRLECALAPEVLSVWSGRSAGWRSDAPFRDRQRSVGSARGFARTPRHPRTGESGAQGPTRARAWTAPPVATGRPVNGTRGGSRRGSNRTVTIDADSSASPTTLV